MIDMTIYRCNVCNVFEYDSDKGRSVDGIKAGIVPQDFPATWKCPICGVDRTHMKPVSIKEEKKLVDEESLKVYLGPWKRASDDLETHMSDIHMISDNGVTITDSMRTHLPVPSWDQILIKGAQLAKLPLDLGAEVNARTTIGPRAEHPLVIETPLLVTHMSFGALSKEAKIALAKGSAAVKTAIGSGEGGILEEERASAYKQIFEYVPNRYSVTDENLRRADAIEIKFGQSVKPGLGGHLPGVKVTEEIAKIRGFPPGIDIFSPSRFSDINDREELLKKVSELRQRSGGKPIGIKVAAGDIEEDLKVALYARPDFVTIDGRPGSTAAAYRFIKDSASIPTVFALHRARKLLDHEEAKDVSLVITGGLRVSTDFAKALALGADAVAIGTAALMAIGCQQYRICHTGKCPVGITTQDPDLRARFNVEYSAKKLEHFLRVSTEEVKEVARMTGSTDVHGLNVSDLYTADSEISGYMDIPQV